MRMLTRVKKYNRLPFIINKMERKKMIFLFLNEQKKKRKRATDIPLRKGTLDNVFAPKT